MSVVERTPVTGRLARPRRPNARFLRSELWLIFGRRRNWAGLAVLASLPVIIAISSKISPPGGGGGGEGPDFFASITSNGLFVALAALTVELPLFLPLAVSAISAAWAPRVVPRTAWPAARSCASSSRSSCRRSTTAPTPCAWARRAACSAGKQPPTASWSVSQ